jgi:DNA-binding LacI/PurR family transcriptional regulator
MKKPVARVTLQSIADTVGVSRMTVSNAFSRPDQLSSELRDKILSVADGLGYGGPDPAARALARGRTGSIGLLLNGQLSEAFADAVSAEFLAAVSDALGQHGLALTLLTPPAESGEGAFFPARDVAMDGVLVYTCKPESAGVSWLEKRGLPIVTVDQHLRRGVPGVNVDDRGGARDAAQYLLDLGHRRIGILTLQDAEHPGDSDDLTAMSDNYPATERLRGWRDALSAADVDPVIALAAITPAQAAFEVALTLLDRPDRPTAVLCFSDVFAIGVLHAAERLGLTVPDDLSVVGFDDNPLAAAAHPPLTTVRQDVTAKGRTAVAALVETMADHKPRVTKLPTRLVVRSSAAPPV